MPVRSAVPFAAGAAFGAALILAAPAAAQCWSGGAPGQGVPRESLLVTNRAPFAVHIMAGPAGGARRVLGQVPAGTTRSFPSVLPPGRNETTLWIDPADAAGQRIGAAQARGVIVIANRGALTCRRAAQLEVTPADFAAGPQRAPGAARGNDLGRLAPAAGPRTARPRLRRAPAPPAPEDVRQPGPPASGGGIVR